MAAPRRRTLTPEERTERKERFARKAGKRYDRLWERTRDAFGADAHDSPYVNFNAGRNSYANSPPGRASVYLSNKRTRQLARLGKPVLTQHERQTLSKPKKVRTRRSRKIRRNSAKQLAIHEWAHLYQDKRHLGALAEKTGLSTRALSEGGAENFAKHLVRRRFGRSNRPKDPANVGTYDLYQRDVRKLGKRHMKRGQFGDNWGWDPRTRR